MATCVRDVMSPTDERAIVYLCCSNVTLGATGMGISLWLVPRASQAANIKLVMRVKPTTTHSPSSFPEFHPHVTLASSRDATALRAAIPAEQRVVPVRFKSLEVGDKYYMSVYVAVHTPPGSPLKTLREHLRARLGSEAVPPVAHLSLYYIDDADEAERARTAETLRSELRVLESGRGEERVVRLACVDDDVEGEQEPEILDGFDGDEIWVVRCEGPVPEWEVLEKISLVR
ncbi:2',3'-cyclic-nucleotide 3'-phosphodiesterase [Trametes punicea]|nr:2',3'-cyclic-nucleotide 3'-phosphodiesterase [Trametes punicea]